MTEAPDDLDQDITDQTGEELHPGDYVPEADAVEQWTPARAEQERPSGHPHAQETLPPASEWDEAEQAQDVPLDDDEYR